MTKHHLSWRSRFLLTVNPVNRYMIISDFLWMGSVGLLVPIFALFVEETIAGGNAAVIGTAAAIYLVTKSIVQILVASVTDRIKGEWDDFWLLFCFSLMAAAFPLTYLVMETPVHLFIIQFTYGVLLGFTFPTFMAIFTRHINEDKAGTGWGVYYSVTDLGSAFTAFAGGIIATTIGFTALITISVSVSIAGVFLLLPLRRYLRSS